MMAPENVTTVPQKSVQNTPTKQSHKNLQISCKNCIFQKLDKNENQEACYIQDLDQLDHFTASEEGREYIIIKGLCQYRREPQWQGERTFVDALIDVRKEVEINYAAVIYPTECMESLYRTIASLDAQELAPRKLIIIANTKYTQEIINWCHDNVQTNWTVVDRKTNEDCRDMMLRKFKEYHFMAFFHAGYEIPPDKFKKLDIAINEKYLRFTMIDGDEDGNGLILSQPMYQTYITTAENLVKLLKLTKKWIRFTEI